MNSVALEPVRWKPRRWILLFGFIFAAQTLLIFWLSAPMRIALHPVPSPSPSIRLVAGPMTELKLAETFLASDPTLFAVASRDSFSGEAWLKIPKRNYDISERVESPFWLPLDARQLADGIGQFVRTNVIAPIPIAENIAPKILAVSPTLDLTENAQTQSRFRVEGDVASRKLIASPELKSWPGSEILSNTVAQIAVNPAGTVVAARILSRSGSADADRFALDAAREIQFAPGNEAEPTWGSLVFDWHTVPVATTNAVNENPGK